MISMHKEHQEALVCFARPEMQNSGKLQYNNNKQGETRTTHGHAVPQEDSLVQICNQGAIDAVRACTQAK